MAALATSAVTIVRSFQMGSASSKKIANRFYIQAVLSGQGTIANAIPASVFGLTRLHWCSNFTDGTATASATEVIPAGVDGKTNQIVLGGGTSNALADYTGTFNFIVEGD